MAERRWEHLPRTDIYILSEGDRTLALVVHCERPEQYFVHPAHRVMEAEPLSFGLLAEAKAAAEAAC